MIAVDTETTGLYVDDGARVTTVSSYDDVTGGLVDPVENCPWLSNLKEHKLIFQNAKFDLTMFKRGGPGLDLFDNFFWDTREASGLLWPTGPTKDGVWTTGLKPVAEWLWGEEETEPERRLKAYLADQPKKLKKRYDLVPWEIHAPYALQDAKLTFKLYQRQVEEFQMAELHAADLYNLFQRELSFERVLYKMEERGIGFDVEAGRTVAEGLRATLQELEAALPVRPTRQQMVKYWWEADEGAPEWVARTEKTEAVQLDEYTLWRLVKLQYPYAAKFKDYLAVKDALSRWYDDDAWVGKCGKDGRLRVDYRQNGAITGRLSGSRVNLQAVPQDHTLSRLVPSVRKLFTPKPGFKLWGIDLSQAELRIAASLAKSRLARKYLENGVDMHGELAKQVFNVTESSPEWKKYRYIAKTTNFAALYAAGPRALASQITREGKIDYTEDQALQMIRHQRQMFPEFKQETEIAASKAKERGWVKTVSGRKIYFQSYEHRYFKAFNNVIQGNVAEFMKDLMIWIEQRFPSCLLLQIHDEVVLELPEGETQALQDIAHYMAERASDVFHIKMVAEPKPFGRNEYD